jgi:tRNA A-37 threonylcarbamoyl transferase component Bud32
MTVSAKAGRYELIEEIGRGAMGIVYRANDPVIGRPVAVKTMRLANAGSGLSHDDLLARFQTEARAAGRLTHPNIVVVYDAGEEDGLLYITMELIEGPSLQALIEAKQTFPLPRILRLIEQACSALDFAHQHKIIHRDIKPANLMLTPDDTLKITDFGTAKILQYGAMQTAQIIGTPSYMSPEQIKGRPVDGRSDIFSLGVVLYELVTGQKPFPGDSVTTVIYKIVNEDPVPPQQLDSSIHPGLSAVIAKALAKPVEQRFQTCAEFSEALRNYNQYRKASAEATMVLPGSATPRVPPDMAAMAAARGAAPARVPNTARTHHPMPSEAAPAKRRGSFLLVLLLLAVIGAAGYQVLPAVREIWQRSQADREAAELALRPATTLIEKAAPLRPATAVAPVPVPPAPAATEEPSPVTSSAETVPPKSPEPPEAAAKTTKPVQKEARATTEKSVAPAPPDVPRPVPNKPAAQPTDTAMSVPEATARAATAPAAAAEATAPAVAAPYKPSRPPITPAAAAWQLRISAILVESDIADQVKVVATGNTLTLTGTLRLAQHRKLLARLRNVPDRLQIIDDIEYAPEEPAAEGATPPEAPDSAPSTQVPGR